MTEKNWVEEVFNCRKPIIAMCHFSPLPGDPAFNEGGDGEGDQVARKDLLALRGGGVKTR